MLPGPSTRKPAYLEAAEDLRRNPGQWQFYESTGHCVALAGPGSGKTKTLTIKMARLLVEADYRMKLVGMGLEDGTADVPSYLKLVSAEKGAAPPPMDVLRWWFTLKYDAVQATADRDAFEIRGPGVQVLSENEMLTALGERVHTGQSEPLNSGFAQRFTKHFGSLTEKYPVYADLKQYVYDTGKASGAGDQVGSVLYSRGMYAALVISEAIRKAQDKDTKESAAAAKKAGKAPGKWPYRAFWLPVGADREANGDPKFIGMGKGKETSRLVLPIALGLPAKAEQVELKRFYVGADLLAKEVTQLLTLCQPPDHVVEAGLQQSELAAVVDPDSDLMVTFTDARHPQPQLVERL